MSSSNIGSDIYDFATEILMYLYNWDVNDAISTASYYLNNIVPNDANGNSAVEYVMESGIFDIKDLYNFLENNQDNFSLLNQFLNNPNSLSASQLNQLYNFLQNLLNFLQNNFIPYYVQIMPNGEQTYTFTNGVTVTIDWGSTLGGYTFSQYYNDIIENIYNLMSQVSNQLQSLQQNNNQTTGQQSGGQQTQNNNGGQNNNEQTLQQIQNYIQTAESDLQNGNISSAISTLQNAYNLAQSIGDNSDAQTIQNALNFLQDNEQTLNNIASFINNPPLNPTYSQVSQLLQQTQSLINNLNGTQNPILQSLLNFLDNAQNTLSSTQNNIVQTTKQQMQNYIGSAESDFQNYNLSGAISALQSALQLAQSINDNTDAQNIQQAISFLQNNEQTLSNIFSFVANPPSNPTYSQVSQVIGETQSLINSLNGTQNPILQSFLNSLNNVQQQLSSTLNNIVQSTEEQIQTDIQNAENYFENNNLSNAVSSLQNALQLAQSINDNTDAQNIQNALNFLQNNQQALNTIFSFLASPPSNPSYSQVSQINQQVLSLISSLNGTNNPILQSFLSSLKNAQQQLSSILSSITQSTEEQIQTDIQNAEADLVNGGVSSAISILQNALQQAQSIGDNTDAQNIQNALNFLQNNQQALSDVLSFLANPPSNPTPSQVSQINQQIQSLISALGNTQNPILQSLLNYLKNAQGTLSSIQSSIIQSTQQQIQTDIQNAISDLQNGDVSDAISTLQSAHDLAQSINDSSDAQNIQDALNFLQKNKGTLMNVLPFLANPPSNPTYSQISQINQQIQSLISSLKGTQNPILQSLLNYLENSQQQVTSTQSNIAQSIQQQIQNDIQNAESFIQYGNISSAISILRNALQLAQSINDNTDAQNIQQALPFLQQAQTLIDEYDEGNQNALPQLQSLNEQISASSNPIIQALSSMINNFLQAVNLQSSLQNMPAQPSEPSQSSSQSLQNLLTLLQSGQYAQAIVQYPQYASMIQELQQISGSTLSQKTQTLLQLVFEYSQKAVEDLQNGNNDRALENLKKAKEYKAILDFLSQLTGQNLSSDPYYQQAVNNIAYAKNVLGDASTSVAPAVLMQSGPTLRARSNEILLG